MTTRAHEINYFMFDWNISMFMCMYNHIYKIRYSNPIHISIEICARPF